MATVPIEIILQDAEVPVDPTPTPESGEETNIVVPNTGTIGNEGNNSGGTGSTISIILPIVIAVLSLGAMLTLLIRRQQKRKSNVDANISKKEKFAAVASGTIAILAATVLVGNLVIPATNAATDESNGSEEGAYLETEDKITITAIIDKDSEEDAYIVSTKDILYATTDASGYTVTMSMIEGALTSNLYLDGDETSEYYIAPVEESTELSANIWGYTLNEETEEYNAVPLADTPATIKEGEEAVTHEEIDVYYTVKVNKELPLGTYSGEIEYNITPVNPIDKLTYMQDFATLPIEEKEALIASMPEGEQYILKDKRDEKPYYISKLADGNVWMTQNLDHNIVSTPDFYTSANTDLPSGNTWTGTATRATSDTDWTGSNTAPESYDLGVLYWNGVVVADETTCTQYGGTWQPWGRCSGASPTVSSGDNSHYHLGNYYNWTAAVAMSDSSSYGMYDEETDSYLNTEADQSICPAGWMLPTKIGDKSFDNLVVKANLTSGVSGNVQDIPAYFVYGGELEGGPNMLVGSGGSYWSSVASGGSGSYLFGFDAYGNLSGNASIAARSKGISVRCVAR